MMSWTRATVYAVSLFAAAVVAMMAFGEKTTMALVLGGAVYLLPTIVAYTRKVPNTGSVFVINLFLGWTLIGWVVALAMAARSVPQTQPR